MPRAAATPAPPLEPPDVRSVFHGFRVTPDTGLSVMPLCPYSGVVVLPKITPPAARMRVTSTSSWSGT